MYGIVFDWEGLVYYHHTICIIQPLPVVYPVLSPFLNNSYNVSFLILLICHTLDITHPLSFDCPFPYSFLHSPLRNYYKVSFLISLSSRILGPVKD